MSVSLVPCATYRVQFSAADFGFDDAAEAVHYLAQLGISHLYCSPYLQSAPHSEHGYDVVDYRRLNEELGGAAGHSRLCAVLKAAAMGLILDIVPNHMAIGPENPWWWDVLENGPASAWASYFDVDWEPPESRLRNMMLLPVLGDQYGRILEAGEIRLTRSGAKFAIAYHERSFPVEPRSLEKMLSEAAAKCGCDELLFIAGAIGRLPRPTATDRQSVDRRRHDQGVIVALLARLLDEQPAVAGAIDRVAARINADSNSLHELLEQQNYRLAFWRAAQRDLGYRRFFDVNNLIGLRMEDPRVFFDTHSLILRLLSERVLDGVRVDHIDGLRDPAAYLQRLRAAAERAFIVVEKVLATDEALPDWPVAGTTGYDFLNLAGGLFIDPAGQEPLTRFYAEFTGETANFPALAREAKDMMMRQSLGSELGRLTALLLEICEASPAYRDYTRHELHEALVAVAAHFDVYRTYVREDGAPPGAADVRRVSTAVAAAKAARSDLDSRLLDFLGDILLLRQRGRLETELAMRFQQFTGAVMAKAVEDTVFYRYNRLICLNEVGGNPERFGVSPVQFHHACQRAQQIWPAAMLATATHDTKRGEDVRARLCVLSEMPARWISAVSRWTAINAAYWNGIPDRNAEYLFYQTVVGAWPIELPRLLGFMHKAVREAKQRTSWTNPDTAYEEMVREFVTGAIGDRHFVADLEMLLADLVAPGRINSLSQTLLKLTAPGVPDFYQGTELWDLSLVDPDNRRPIDYARRRALLAETQRLGAADVMKRADDGLPKLWLIHRALMLRRSYPELFAPIATYRPLIAHGDLADHVVAFCRAEAVITVVPRLVAGIARGWRGTALALPPGAWRDRLSERMFDGGQAVEMSELTAAFPVCLLHKETQS